ncbi:hypothetical protein IMY05_C4869000100 [Salix suchowensis]|nr:hypothetical protein IMY05_C4869000100 [Salix suchowensis]
MGQTMPPNDEGLEEDMELSVAAMRPRLVSHWIRTDWRSLTTFTGMAGGCQGADDSAGNRELDRRGEVGAVTAARKDLLEGEAALASWKLARENAAREAEDAKRAAQGGGKTPGKAARGGSGGVPPTGNAPPQAPGTNARKGSRTDRAEMEEAEKSGDGKGVQKAPVGLWALGAAIVIDALLKQKTRKGAESSAAKEAGRGPPRATVAPSGGVSQGVKEGDDASSDDSPLMPPKKKRKLPAPRDDKEEGPDTPRAKRRLRRSTIKTEAKARIITSPDIQEDAEVWTLTWHERRKRGMMVSLHMETRRRLTKPVAGNADPNSPAWTCQYYPKACHHPVRSWPVPEGGAECVGTGCIACQSCSRAKDNCSHSTWRTAPRRSTTRPSEKKEANPAAGRSNGSHSTKTPQIARPSSQAAKTLPCLSSVSYDAELRELQTQLALVNLRLQNHVRASNESANVIHSTIMAFGTTIMRREAEEDERAMRTKGGNPTEMNDVATFF